MAILIAGLVIFLGTHLFTVFRGARSKSVGALKPGGYKIAYSLVSLIGFVLIIWGFAQARAAGTVQVWTPPAFFRHITMLINLPVFSLLVAAYVPGRIGQAVKHPMLLAVILWSVAHLLANGELRSILLFGGFLAWALISRFSQGPREAAEGAPKRGGPVRNDIIAVVIGLVLYAVMVVWLHPMLIGVSVLP